MTNGQSNGHYDPIELPTDPISRQELADNALMNALYRADRGIPSTTPSRLVSVAGEPIHSPRFKFIDPDASLRPKRLDDIIGQEDIKNTLRRFMSAATRRKACLDHTLISGPSGLGKTTFANVIATEMDHNLIMFNGQNLTLPEISKMVIRIANSTDAGAGKSCVVFIDEIHALPKESAEALLTIMEDFIFEEDMPIPEFTMVGATTNPSKIPLPLKQRFGINYKLSYYSPLEIEMIMRRTFRVLLGRSQENMDAVFGEGTPAAAMLSVLVPRARHIPRIANNIVKRTLDFVIDPDSDENNSVVYSDDRLTPEVARECMAALGIDMNGLTPLDRAVIVAMASRYYGRPVGVAALASAVGIAPSELEFDLEPDLVRLGFINRESRGRVLTAKGRIAAAFELEGDTKF